jgi:hypothetical protein
MGDLEEFKRILGTSVDVQFPEFFNGMRTDEDYIKYMELENDRIGQDYFLKKNKFCHNTIIGQLLTGEAKIAIPIPESVVDKYMKTRDETNPENRTLSKLQNDLSNELRKAYPDYQSLKETGQLYTSDSKMSEIYGELGIHGVRELEIPQYAEYDSYKNRVVNQMRISERTYIEAKRQQWKEDRFVQRMEECRKQIDRAEQEAKGKRNRAGPLINLRSQNNHNLINVKNLKNAAISKRMENFNGLKMGGTRKMQRKNKKSKNNKSRKVRSRK